MLPYHELPIESTISSQVMAHMTHNTQWQDYYGWSATAIPLDLLCQDVFFSWLYARHKFQVGVLRMRPWTCYDWHIDTNRGVGINQLLTPHVRSMCVFGHKNNQLTFKFQELVYQPSRYYMFNTQFPHTVYNFDQPRYLLSIEFEKDKHHLSFDNLLDDIVDNYGFGRPD